MTIFMRSVPANKKDDQKKRGWPLKVAAVFIWLIVWYLLALFIGEPIILPSPLLVIARFVFLIGTIDFWRMAYFTFSRIVLGFMLAFILGSLLAVGAAKNNLLHAFFIPPLAALKSTPVASIVILLLAAFRPATLPLIVASLIVLPIVYTNTLAALLQVDQQMLEMARSFNMSRCLTIRAVYLASLRSYLLAAAASGASIAFKAGVAAEIIAVPMRSLGVGIYEAKIHLATDDLFAITIAVVLLGTLFERLFVRALSLIIGRLERPPQTLSKRKAQAIATESRSDIVIDKLTFDYRYETKDKLFEGFSFIFPAGETSIITGPSGSGKTTLLNLILGFITPQSGTISGLTNRRAVVFQEDRLLNHLSARDNLAFVCDDKTRIENILSSLGLKDCARKTVSHLSGGEKRRVAVARALAHEAPLVVLDEPVRSLDPALANLVATVIAEYGRGKTVIEVSHERHLDDRGLTHLQLGSSQ